jgi:hypothetical protein
MSRRLHDRFEEDRPDDQKPKKKESSKKKKTATKGRPTAPGEYA